MAIEEQVEQLRRKVEQLRTEKVRAEERLNALREQRDVLLQSLQALNLTPEQLPEEIQKLQTHIEQEVQKIEAQIPEGY